MYRRVNTIELTRNNYASWYWAADVDDFSTMDVTKSGIHVCFYDYYLGVI